jgi:hypothetical protein
MTYIYIILFIFICYCLDILRQYKLKDILSPKRWKAVYIWLLKRHLSWIGENDRYLTTNELLQYSFRVANCGDCLQNGKCLHCGCDAEGRINGTTDSCSALKWGPFLSDNEMKDFLKNNKLEFKVDIKPKDDSI